MNNETQKDTVLLSAPCEGEAKEVSDHTPQTQFSGEEMIATPDAEVPSEQEREERFRALMEGEYKDLFTAYFQETFNRRFKEHKTIKSELDRARAVVAAAEARFGTREHGELLTAIRAEKSTTAPTDTEQGSPASLADPSANMSIEEQLSTACANARREVLESIRARGLRPAEGALNATSDRMGGVSRLNRTEREELARRAARGEKITL